MSLKLGFVDSRIVARALIALMLSGAAIGCSDSKNNPVTGNGKGPVKVGDPVDINGDGKADGIAVDSNGDGVPDGVDLNNDGVSDVGLPPGLEIDTNGDGKSDGTTIDSDGDGQADGIDIDGDGIADVDLGGADGGPMGCTSNCPGSKPPGMCGDTAFELTAAKTNVMFLIDGSSSMEMYWNQARQAIADIVNANPKLNFGVHLFSAEGGDLGSFIRALNACGDINHDRIEVKNGGTQQGQLIVDTLGTAPPGAGTTFFDRSPVLEGMNWYLENDSPLNDPESANFLIIFSDFVDTCFGTLFSNPGSVADNAGSEQLLAFEKLAIELRKRHIRVIPMGFDGDPSNNGSPGAAGDVNMEALASITSYGGTTISEPLLASEPKDVADAIEQIGVAVQPCRFTVPVVASGEKNAFKLSFIVNGKIVPRDRTKMKGWDFVDGETSEVEFFGADCKVLQAGGATLEAREECSDDPVCGVGATKITTRAQAMHILLDGSGSMQGGPQGWFNALVNGTLTPWGEATAAISQMVVDPINDNVEFGFQFFPSSAEGGCGDVGAPEVAVKQGTEITIIDQLLSNVPNGTTPLVEAMEYVADNPGRLVEKDVLGSVLLVSDGGDSCAEAGMRNELLATASSSLQSGGVDVYAVKFDSGSSDAAQEAQLNNIAINGGTAPAAAIPGDPMYVEGTPGYINAPDGQTLTDELLKLSGSLANCELRIGNPPPGAKADELNIYLNGILVPYDSKGDKKSGWGWVSDVSMGDFTKLELYGKQCELLQKSRLNDIVIEFGCKVEIVQ